MADMRFLKSARGRVMDDVLLLKAKGTVATSMVGENPIGTDKYYDTGGGRTRGDVVYNVYAIAGSLGTSSLITLRLQGSKNSSFTTGYDLVINELGKSNMLTGNSSLATGVPLGVGRYTVPFTNDFGGTVYRYLRHYISTNFTVTTNRNLQYDYYLADIIT